jgi:hypothetical protein
MWMLKASLTCLALSLMALLFVPLTVAKICATGFAFLFVLFLVLGLLNVERFANVAPSRRA